MTKIVKVCGNCKFRDKNGYCKNKKIRETDSCKDKDDELVYIYNEDGFFLVGVNFGCVHFRRKLKQ